MIRLSEKMLLSAVVALLAAASPAHAGDDGGFGTQRFSSNAPAALGNPDAFNPAAVEPASGVDATATDQDQTAQQPETQNTAEPQPEPQPEAEGQ